MSFLFVYLTIIKKKKKKEDWMANVWDNLGEGVGVGFSILISLCTLMISVITLIV